MVGKKTKKTKKQKTKMSEQAWALFLFAAEIVGLSANYFLVRKKNWLGWLCLIAFVSLPWLVYSISTAKVGFVLLSLMWLFVYVSNAVAWKKKVDSDHSY